MISKPKTTVAGIYGAGGNEAGDNPTLEKVVKAQGGKMFTSSYSGGDDEIIDYLKQGFKKGNRLKIYGYSRGGAAAVRIANKLGAMNVHISEVNLYDPVSLDGNLVFNYPNVTTVNYYYERNPTDLLRSGFNANNPFMGSPVSANFHGQQSIK
ncbi:MAG: hypothetical protein V4589_10655 [Bacteroidota bacterium]